MLCPYSNRLVSQSQNTSNGIAQKHKLRGSWTSFTALIAKGLLRTWCCWVKQDSDRMSSIQNLMQLSTVRLWQRKVQSRTWRGWVRQTLYTKGSIQNMMQSSTTRIVSCNMTTFLVLNHERVRYCDGLLKPNNNHWCDHFANDNINHLQDASTLHLQKLDDSLANKPISTYAIRAIWMLAQKADLQSIVEHNCKHLSANHQQSYCSFFI